MGIYKVIKYNTTLDAHECKAYQGGGTEFFDLLVSNCFPEIKDPEELIDKDIVITKQHPFIQIADEVHIFKQPNEKKIKGA